MKKILPYALIILFPYTIVFVVASMFANAVYLEDGTSFIFGVLAFYLLALISTIVLLIIILAKKRNSEEVLLLNMIIKLIHIPAYIVLFLCAIILFVGGMPLIITVLDALTILLSGLIGVGGIIRLRKENGMSKKLAILACISQFIYCLDVFTSIMLYIIAKKRNAIIQVQNT